MVLSLTSITFGLHNASEERLTDSPRDLVVSSIGLEPSIENSHNISSSLDSDKDRFDAVMPLLTVIGTIAIPDVEGVEFTPLDQPRELSIKKRLDVGLVGLVPEMADDFMDDDTLIIRSERMEIEGWFDVESDPFFNSVSPSDFTSEIILDKTIMEEYSLSDGDIVYFMNQKGILTSSLKVTGKVRTSLLGGGLTNELVSGLGILHLSELQRLTGNHFKSSPLGNRSDLTNAIYIDLDDEWKEVDKLQEVVMYLEGIFPGLKVTSKESRLYRLEEEVAVLEIFSFGVGITTLFISVIFLSSIMILDVEDRQLDISIMRAIGISRRTIYLQILKEFMLIAVIGSILGTIPGIIGSDVLDEWIRSYYGVNISFVHLTPLTFILCFVFLFAFVVIFSILPGWRSTSTEVRRGLSLQSNR